MGEGEDLPFQHRLKGHPARLVKNADHCGGIAADLAAKAGLASNSPFMLAPKTPGARKQCLDGVKRLVFRAVR